MHEKKQIPPRFHWQRVGRPLPGERQSAPTYYDLTTFIRHRLADFELVERIHDIEPYAPPSDLLPAVDTDTRIVAYVQYRRTPPPGWTRPHCHAVELATITNGRIRSLVTVDVKAKDTATLHQVAAVLSRAFHRPLDWFGTPADVAPDDDNSQTVTLRRHHEQRTLRFMEKIAGKN